PSRRCAPGRWPRKFGGCCGTGRRSSCRTKRRPPSPPWPTAARRRRKGHGTMAEKLVRILVVDDEPSARGLVRRGLEMEHYEVVLAEDGWEALRRIRDDRPDLVVLDMMMPHLDGIAVIKKVREDPEIAALPILMLTARDRAVDKAFGLEAAA